MNSIDVSTKIGNISLSNPIYNAAGVNCVSLEELQEMLDSESGAVITKSSTLNSRQGNPLPRYAEDKNGSINSSGLPNLGIKKYLEWLSNTKSKKPIFISIAPLNEEELKEIIKLIDKCDAVILPEINFSCPNVIGKPQIGYDILMMKHYLDTIISLTKKDFGIKLPPYFDVSHFEETAKVLNCYTQIKYLTCINSLGNGMMIDIESEKVSIAPKNGLGGIGGTYCLPIALSNVHNFYKLCPDKQIIGCGGIISGKEVFMHILAGASAVQIGTHLYQNGVKVFNRIIIELKEIMAKKGYHSISDFYGKLEYLNN